MIHRFLANVDASLISILVLVLLTYLHASGLYIFSQGFLLSRQSLSDRSKCSNNNGSSHYYSAAEEENTSFFKGCNTPPPTHSKLILILIDALRYDFLLPHNSSSNDDSSVIDPFNHNQLTLPAQLTQSRPAHSSLFHFLADPPTTTLQRLKGLTTGTLPTFIDLGSNFASTNLFIEEDSWLAQLHHSGKKIGFVGDDTWLKLFGTDYVDKDNRPHRLPPELGVGVGGLFDPSITVGFESFNVEDLDTVDEGVERHFYEMLGITSPDSSIPSTQKQDQDWDVLIGHFLGLDHAGHRFGASHPKVQSKLRQYDRFLDKIMSQLDDETLLVVLGDHGMDPKGDHGGDSFLELSTALWMYSKTRPLINRLPSWTLEDPSSFIDLQPSMGRTRTVSQIDLVPTLSLLLGVPIPFSNLGMIIPEFFFRDTVGVQGKSFSASETLSISMAKNSAQLWTFVDRYTNGSSSSRSTGQDLAQHLSELTALYNRAKELSDLKRHVEAFQAHRLFANSLLSTSRRIWAKFLPSLMVIGIFIMSLSFLVSCKLIKCIRWTSRGPDAPIRTTLATGISTGLLGLGLGLLSHLTPRVFPADVQLFSRVLVGSSMGICVGILTHRPRRNTWFSLPSAATLLKLFPAILHGISLGSNSYTVWEDRVVLHLLSFTILLPILMSSFSAPQKRLRNRLLLFSLLFGICVRLISLSTVCREEQGGNCRVAFYASSTSSNAPNWVMSILLPLALALPLVPAWFLGFSDSYRGPASFYFGSVWRIILLCGVQYWITDYIVSHEDLSLSSDLIQTGHWIKLMVGRVDLVLCLFSGGILWLILPLCIDLKREEPSEEDEKNKLSVEDNNKKPRLLVIGFANSYGSSYLILLTAGFGFLFLVSQPVGQVVLSLGFFALLCLVEMNDSLGDVANLKKSFSKAIESAAQPVIQDGKAVDDDEEEEEKVVDEGSEDCRMVVGMNLMGYLLFFGTGHQATFASIQWKTGFIGLESAHQLFSGSLILGNTLSGFILVGLSLPLLKLWNRSPSLNLNNQRESSSTTLDSEVLLVKLKLINLNVMLNIINLVCVFYLRRHLMVWKIFCPRFLLSCLVLLCFDFVFVFLSCFALPLLKSKVSRCFGSQNYI